MDNATARQLVSAYVEGWKLGDRSRLLSALDPNCIIIESHGPTYRGVEQIGRWVDGWLASGGKVVQWDVTSFFAADETGVFEWVFEYSDGTTGELFDGITLVHFTNGKIGSMREYRRTAAPYEWEG